MSQYRVALICNDPRVLPELSNYLKEPWSTIVEEDEIYYWLSSYFETLESFAEVDEYSDRLLPRLNGLVKLHFINAGELFKAGIITFTDNQGQHHVYRHFSASVPVTYRIGGGDSSQQEIKRLWLNLAQKSMEEKDDSSINHALSHYGKEANWHNLYDVYEIIKVNYNRSKGIENSRNFIPLPEEWTRDETGRGREKDFTESANNVNLSGLTARHSIAKSNPVVSVPNTSLVKVISGNKEVDILPMTLDKAKIFIAGLLTQWLSKRE